MKHLVLQKLLFLKTNKTTEEIFMTHSKSWDVVWLYGTWITDHLKIPVHINVALNGWYVYIISRGKIILVRTNNIPVSTFCSKILESTYH